MLTLCLLFLAAGGLLTVGVVVYWHYVGNLLERDAVEQIVSAGNETAESFRRALEADQRIVDTIAITVQNNYPWRKTNQLGRFLNLQVKYNEFDNLGIIPLSGEVLLARPVELDHTWLQHILTETLKEETYLSSRYTNPANGRSVLVVAASLHDGLKPVGVLFALVPTERYKSLLTLPSAGESGLSYVISPSGELQAAGRTMTSTNMLELLSWADFSKEYPFSALREQVKNGEPIFMRYRLGGRSQLLYGVSLQVNGWYLLSILSTDFIQAQAQHLTGVSLMLFAFIVLLFGLLVLYMFRLRAYSNYQLFKTAFVDNLTGVDNLNRMIQLFPDRVRGVKESAALAIFDILKFKAINDMLGYERGNQILQRVALVLQANLTSGEHVCRSAADNFVLLLSFNDRKDLRARLNHLITLVRRDCTAAETFMMVNSVFGVYELAEPVPFYIALDRARLALENAKRSSAKEVQFYDEKDRHRILRERQLEGMMEQALADGSFALMLQPKIGFQSGRMEGAEVLVRWYQPDRGLVRPDDFIPLFEKNGFILKLDMFILSQSAKLLAKWYHEGKEQVPLSVNFSRLHLNDSRYIPQMSKLVDEHQVPHRLIEVELTETVILNNRELAQSVVRGLHNKGFSVAMDDFGSGYSSLNVLKSLQFDSIKLDKEFLSGSEQNETARKVVQGAVEMIKSIGATVVAEGVETADQAEFLRRIGCDVAQGYYFSRPLPVKEFEQLLLPRSTEK